MKYIAKNDYYELAYENSENIVYWKMKGFWKDMSVVPDFHIDWEKARKLTRPGWKILSDASECKVIPSEVNTEKIKNQEKALNTGCSGIALIVNSAITKISLLHGAEASGADEKIRIFASSQAEEAVKWLREIKSHQE